MTAAMIAGSKNAAERAVQYDRAIRICQDSVIDRLDRDGFRDTNFLHTVPDDKPGRNDWVIGRATGRRRAGSRNSTSLFVDFTSGRVRSVDVRRR